MIRLEIDTTKGEVTIHVDDEGAVILKEAAEDALNRQGKVIIGDPGALLIVRHREYK